MDKCSNCNADMRPQASFCSRCGTKRVRAEIPDTVGVVPQSNGASSFTWFPPGKALPTRYLEHTVTASTLVPEKPADPPLPPDEASDQAPALPMDRDIPHTPLPDEPADPAAPPDEASNLAPALLANGDILDAPPLEELVSVSESLPEEEVINANDTLSPATSPEALSPYEPILDAIEQLFRFLDKDKEDDNRKNIANVRQNNLIPGLMVRLSAMCRRICQQVIEEYIAKPTERYLSNKDLELAMLLGDYAIHNSSVNQSANAKKYWCMLDTLCELRSGHLTPSAIMRRVRNQYRQETGGLATAPPWKDIASVVSSYLYEQGQAQELMPDIPEMARQWVEAYSDRDTVDEEAYKTVLDAAQHFIPKMINPLSFLTKAEQASLLDHMRNLRFEQIGTLLRPRQAELLSAFSDALYDPGFGQILPPRRSIHMIYKNVEFIPWIKELLARQDERAPEQALKWFEWVHDDEYVPTEYAPVLREWHLYVKARARGPLEAFDEWQEDVNQAVASWEEIWNMAATLHEKYTVNSLKVLMPGVKSQRAPFSHLRFALYCAVTILHRKEKYLKESVALAETFLLENVCKLPLPLSYLTWLALANDAPEVIDPNQHFSTFKVFQHLLDLSITCTYAAHPAHEISIADFERDFQELFLLAQKLERDYVLESPQKSITLKSKVAGTSFRISYNAARSSARKRVGIFVDYENLLFSLPEEMQHKSELIARTLLEHAGTYGDVVSRWICYSPANMRLMSNVKLNSLQQDFQRAGFKIEVPRDGDGNVKIRANQSDSVLIECITTAMIESKLDVYIIVSGDHFYYERVRRLLEKGHTVSIVSYTGPNKKLSEKYSLLEDKRAYMPEAYGDFIIGKIEEIFELTPEQLKALDAEIEKRHRDKTNKV